MDAFEQTNEEHLNSEIRTEFISAFGLRMFECSNVLTSKKNRYI